MSLYISNRHGLARNTRKERERERKKEGLDDDDDTMIL